MTGLEMMIVKELITWGAKAFFDAVQDENNNLDAKQAKGFSKQAMDGISEEAKKAILHHLPKHLKL